MGVTARAYVPTELRVAGRSVAVASSGKRWHQVTLSPAEALAATEVVLQVGRGPRQAAPPAPTHAAWVLSLRSTRHALQPCAHLAATLCLQVGPAHDRSLCPRLHHVDVFALPRDELARRATEHASLVALPTSSTALAMAAAALPRAQAPGSQAQQAAAALEGLMLEMLGCTRQLLQACGVAGAQGAEGAAAGAAAEGPALEAAARGSCLALLAPGPTPVDRPLLPPAALQKAAWELLAALQQQQADSASSSGAEAATDAAAEVVDRHKLATAQRQLEELAARPGHLTDEQAWQYMGGVASLYGVLLCRPGALQGHMARGGTALVRLAVQLLPEVEVLLVARNGLPHAPAGLLLPLCSCLAGACFAWAAADSRGAAAAAAASGSAMQQPAQLLCSLLLSPLADVREAAGRAVDEWFQDQQQEQQAAARAGGRAAASALQLAWAQALARELLRPLPGVPLQVLLPGYNALLAVCSGMEAEQAGALVQRSVEAALAVVQQAAEQLQQGAAVAVEGGLAEQLQALLLLLGKLLALPVVQALPSLSAAAAAAGAAAAEPAAVPTAPAASAGADTIPCPPLAQPAVSPQQVSALQAALAQVLQAALPLAAQLPDRHSGGFLLLQPASRPQWPGFQVCSAARPRARLALVGPAAARPPPRLAR